MHRFPGAAVGLMLVLHAAWVPAVVARACGFGNACVSPQALAASQRHRSARGNRWLTHSRGSSNDDSSGGSGSGSGSYISSPWSGVPASEAPMLARPNVLLIMVDDLNDWVGCYGGHPQVITPHIDRLAKRGVRFTSAYTPSPVCGPARNAIFTGRQPFHTGMYSNEDAGWHKSNPGTVLLPRAFQKAGYETLGAGKILHRDTSNDLFGRVFYPKQRWSPFASASVGYTAEELPSKKTADPRHVTFLDGVEHVLPLNRMPSDRSPNETKGESFDWGALDVPDSAMGDGQITDWAIANLLQLDQGEARPLEARAKPFFMAIGYYRPHMPLYAPKRYFDAYAGLEI